MPTIKKTAGSAKATTPAKKVSERSYVYYEAGHTVNMGDYNSARFTVGVTVPVNPTKEELSEIEDALVVAEEIVSNKVSEVLENIKH